MTKTLVVDSCVDCPMMYHDETDQQAAWCGHRDAISGSANRPLSTVLGAIPDWCPLRAEPLHIHLAPQSAKEPA